ncbi:MAG: hypothetical protein HYY17_12765 [Planctomycetes bacterium]|nr:hypothetical protein [Planctomycetota bacterium]
MIAQAVLLVFLAQEFEKPVRIEAGGKPIDTDIGHAAPCLYDFDRDGRRDLLVGQFGEGKLRIYRNVGTEAAPKFADVEWFRAGGEIATTPAG